MARPRQRRKQRSSLPRIKQKPKSKAALRNPQGDPVVAANWDNNATVSQNYRRLGLAAKLNSITGGTERRTGSKRRMEADHPLLIGSKATKIQSTEVLRVERDPITGAILKVFRELDQEDPLDDPLRELDSDSPKTGDHSSPTNEEESSNVVRQLEIQASLEAPQRQRTQSQREKEWIGKLVEKYGENCTRMAMDRKLNPMQQTENDIRKRITLWRDNQSRNLLPTG